MRTSRSLRRTLARGWRDTAFLTAGLLLHLTALAGLILLAESVFLVPVTVPVAIVLAPAGALVLTAAQRWRYRALLGVRLPQLPEVGLSPWPRRALRRFRSLDTWRQVGYHTAVALALAAAELLVLVMGAAGIVFATFYLWAWALPHEWQLSQFGHTGQGALVTAGGLVLLSAAPWCAGTAARLEARVAGVLLGPTQARRLLRRVEDLTESRAALIDAADTERRRIERDLHDGAQQRLVSLAVNLGLARVMLTDMPDDVRQVIDAAHHEAKEAITELGDLVRGLHPAVLEDRGLDAALSGVIARAPLPVRLRASLEGRASPSVEAVAYFVVSEALANVTKLADATRADVTVERIGEVLRLTIADDGVGGADASAGTGLAGLTKRVSSVDGTFRISSPAGGPTVVSVELPCKL